MKMKKKMYGLLAAFAMITICLTVQTAAPTTAEAASKTSKIKTEADSIIKKQTKKSDSKKKKLEKLYKFGLKNWQYNARDAKGNRYFFKGEKNWQQTCGLDMLKNSQGTCYHYAAGFAYLAKRATGYTVRVGVGMTNGFSGNLQQHAWTEIKIGKTWYICDVNMERYTHKDAKAAAADMKLFLKKRTSLKKTYDQFKNVKYTTVKF